MIVAGTVTAIGAAVTDSLIVLAGIAQVYAVGTAIVLRRDVRPIASASDGFPGTAFVAVTVFAVLSVARGSTQQFDYATAILTVGLAYFGLVCGIWLTLSIDRPE